MKLDKAVRAILRVTALAWSIPFARAAASRDGKDDLAVRK